jgi:hypothetical protein
MLLIFIISIVGYRLEEPKRMKCTGHIARTGQMRSAKRVLVGKTEGKIPLGRSRRRWKDNIKWISEKYSRVERLIWIALGTSGSCEHGDEHLISIKCWEFLSSRFLEDHLHEVS